MINIETKALPLTMTFRMQLRSFARAVLLRWVQFKHPGLRADLSSMIRDNLFARLLQGKYIVQDYLQKRPYKIIKYHGEFQQELLFTLPFAYWHHLNGTLRQTISCNGTKDLYFFSPEHLERFDKRTLSGTTSAFHIPNMTHSNRYSYRKWRQVPLKKQYANNIFVFEKPVLVIANKYNKEWSLPPINYFDPAILKEIITLCQDKFQIIYNRPLPKHIVEDNSEIFDLQEHEWIRQSFPGVILLDDLYHKHSEQVNSFNHLQLMVYANTNHFISVHGGTAALASYFGGTNIILSNPNYGRETLLGEYKTIFPRLSGARILHAHFREDIPALIEQHFLSNHASYLSQKTNQKAGLSQPKPQNLM
ncbi:hypothetical protein [Cnuella takakiae]|uniref:hypothetical protein n=1 Tax=Cnuella takakiae TaxID=1302690 RepID=UPI0009340D95|nr:hypothetical protein [Cnuella takakiae]